MKILSIETSTIFSSVALTQDEKLLAEVNTGTQLTHSETLQDHINELFLMTKSEKKVDAVAVSLGPGSFTGLRIGLATAKAIAYAWQVPIIGIPTLLGLAAQFPVKNSHIFPMLDAQKKNCYVAHYTFDGIYFHELEAGNVQAFQQAVQNIFALAETHPSEQFVLTGDFARKNFLASEELKNKAPQNFLLASATHSIPRANLIAELARQKFLAAPIQKNWLDEAMILEPIYIRRSEAEVLFEQRHK